MVNSPEKLLSRRRLFQSSLRYASLGMLGIVGLGSWSKRRRLTKEGKCVNKGICRGCNVLGKCNLPQGLSARDVLGITTDGQR